jgi:sRNA-binding carbon storage regulator CsrA
VRIGIKAPLEVAVHREDVLGRCRMQAEAEAEEEEENQE